MIDGVVKNFDGNKGFGFIKGEDGVDYFVHYSDIKSNKEYKILRTDDLVEFENTESFRGPRALNVKLKK